LLGTALALEPLIRALGQLIVFATGGAGVANTSLIGITET
jgi:hypothetical protein